MTTTELTTSPKIIDAIKKAFIDFDSTDLFSVENDYVSAVKSDRGTIILRPKEPFYFELSIKRFLDDSFPPSEYQLRITRNIIRITKLSCL